MKERGILFSAPMVRSLLAGTKTVTRRLVKPQPEGVEGATFVGEGLLHHPCRDEIARGALDQVGPPVKCPYGVPGDRLWVRETWGLRVEQPSRSFVTFVRYDADRTVQKVEITHADAEAAIVRSALADKVDGPARLQPSIHMPRWASRITLEVTDVRVERLQDITAADARAEGVTTGEPTPGTLNGEPCTVHIFDPIKAFQLLWDGIDGERAPYAENPWVWRVGFRRLP